MRVDADRSLVEHDKLIAFELGWFQRGGGPSSEIREQFGVNDVEFFTQLSAYLEGSDAGLVPARVRDQMRAVARKRLWLARVSS